MYAIVRAGGRQHRVAKGDIIQVDRLDAEEGAEIELDVVMLGGDEPRVGTPLVDGAAVRATVQGEIKGPKILVQHFKPKSRYKRLNGHRQTYTRLKIDSISLS